MKKTLFFLATILSISLASAQITRGTIGNGNYIDWDGQILDGVYGIDFNGDGTNEFNIHDGSYTQDGISYPGGGETHNVMVADPEMWDFYATLNADAPIDANGLWTGFGDAMLSYEGSIPSTFYVGFRIQYDDGMHYGWAKVNFTNNTASWEECYYNATPNAAIMAGQTSGGTQGIEEASTTMNIRSLGNLQLNVTTDGTMPMEIFDLGGRRIMQTYTNTTITLPTMGIYVVRVAQSSHKVLVR